MYKALPIPTYFLRFLFNLACTTFPPGCSTTVRLTRRMSLICPGEMTRALNRALRIAYLAPAYTRGGNRAWAKGAAVTGGTITDT